MKMTMTRMTIPMVIHVVPLPLRETLARSDLLERVLDRFSDESADWARQSASRRTHFREHP